MVSKLRRPGRRAIKWIAGIVIVLIALNMVGMPLVIGVYAAIGNSKDPGPVPEGYEAMTLRTTDGVELGAWYAPPAEDNGAVILLVHGASGSRGTVKDYARMLHDNGFGVLAFDLRGHGDSGGQMNVFGWEGTQDVAAAMAFLRGREEVTIIGGLGTSLGGEVLLGAAGDHRDLRAIVADGATHRSGAEANALPAEKRFPATLYRQIQDFFVGLFTGDDPPTTIMDSLTTSESTRFLLIAAGNVAAESDYNTLFAEAVGDRAQMWVAEDVGHTDAFGRYPEEYTERVLAFFTAAMLEFAQSED